MVAALGPALAEDLAPLRSPSTVGLTQQDFETPEYRNDWGLGAINAATAYARGFTGRGILVGVVDTGIDAGHPEFRDLANPGGTRISPDSADFYAWLPQTPVPFAMPSIVDRDGHGTHVSGTIGAARDGDPRGMMGVAFESTILALRSIVGTSDSNTYNEPTTQLVGDTHAAIYYAVQHGARVINGSYGYSFRDPNVYQTYSYEALDAEYEAIKRAADKDTLLVFAAGNNHVSRNLYNWNNASSSSLISYMRPENADRNVYRLIDQNGIERREADFSSVSGYVVAVVNIDQDNDPNDSSNLCGVAASWCIAAPGTDIYSTWPRNLHPRRQTTDGYYTISGTSMAAPHVAGAAAVLRQALPFLTAPQIAQTMFTTATHLGDGPADAPNATYGWGLLNLGKAIDGPGQFTATWTVNTTSDGQAFYGVFANAISGVGGLTKTGLGTLELTGTNSYQGGTAVYGGTLAVSRDANLGADGTGLTLGDGGRLRVRQDGFATARPVTLDGLGVLGIDQGTATVSGLVADGARSGTLWKTGPGTLALTAANTYTGGTAVYGGALAVSRDANLGAAGTGLTLGNGGGLRVLADGFTTGRPVTLDGLGRLGIDQGRATFAGAMADGAQSGTLEKTGSGTAILSAANTYTGGTRVTGGTLALTATGSLVAPVFVGPTATFANAGLAAGGVDNRGTLTSSGAIAGGLANAGLAFNGGAIAGGAINTGSLTTSGTITGGLTNAGTVLALAGRIDGAVSNQAGLLAVSGPVASGGTLANAPGAVLAVTGTGRYSLAGVLTNAGTVAVAQTAGLSAPAGLSNAGLLTNGGTITGAVTNTGALTTRGTISGSLANAGLAFNGGAITGGANNTGSLITGGTIAGGVSNAGTLVTSGTIAGGLANAGVAFNGGAIAGGASNTGSLITGGTVAGGLTNTGTVLAGAGRIDGAIRNQAGTLAVSGPVASDGPLANAAGATLAVTGAGAYSLAGPLTNAGTVAVAQSARLAAPAGLANAGLVASDGVLDTDLTNAGTARLSGQLNGALINAGSLQVTGPLAGLTSLTNAGPLDLGGGALTVASLSGPAGGVIGNGSITVTGSASATYAGAILESASPTSLTKAGSGSLLLTGPGRFSGPTTVQAGTLALNGFWASPVTVAVAGTLRGIGTVAAPVTVAGALRPGNSPGTLTVLGPVAFAPGSRFGLDIDGPGIGTGAGSYARLLALGPSGGVAADGTLVPELRGITGNAGNRFTPALGQRFAVLTAQAGLTGAFAGLAQPASGLAAGTRFDALYAPTGFDLVVTPAAYGTLAGLGLSQTGNARAVGAALDVARPAAGTRPDAARARVFDPLYAAGPASLPGGLASLSGQAYGDAVMADLAARRLVADTIDRHLRGQGGGAAAFSAGDPGLGPNRSALQLRGGAGGPDQPLAAGEGRIWADALYGFGSRAGDRAAAGADLDAGGLLLGVDRQVGADTRVGGAFSYLRETGASRGAGFGLGRSTTDSYGGTLYAGARLGAVILRGTAGGSYADGRIGRIVALGSALSRASGLASGWDAGVSGFAGSALATGLPVELVPEVGFSYDRLTRTRATERGGLASQGFATGALDAARLLLGGRLASLAQDGTAGLRLEGRAYWAHELADTGAPVRSSLFGVPFAGRTSALGRDGAVLGASLTGPVAEDVMLSLSYTGDLRPGATAQVVSAGLQARW
ncbi:S8 family serine peptidase [Methylobacterium sp. J-026]|uniref:S8 family serine peptidase n=1 Tax=Methylobacterium sp. J-026 TaxID=2836624 RepID=UPI001FB9DB71|nr:S8 family serine peptidase [Methylobacterium sp. J-026]MCJ2137538.1 S8 family serine peptidase [Methylobacterium sp. J-026]